MQDLRSFLASAEKAGELLRVDRETDPLTEMGVLFGETEQPLIFENVRGYPGWQICGELVTSRAAQAVALQIERSQVVPELARRMQSAALPGRNVNTGPVKERILTGRDVDLRKAPGDRAFPRGWRSLYRFGNVRDERSGHGHPKRRDAANANSGSQPHRHGLRAEAFLDALPEI